MGLFMEWLSLFIALMFAYYYGRYDGKRFANKKFLPHDEAPKVGKHKESKEVCSHKNTEILNGLDHCLDCGAVRQRTQTG